MIIIIFSDQNSIDVGQDFARYKDSIPELRGGADVTVLIMQKNVDWCGLGITDAWR